MTEALTWPSASNCTPLRNATSSPPRMLKSKTSISGSFAQALSHSSPPALVYSRRAGLTGSTPPGMFRCTALGACVFFASSVAIMGMWEDTPWNTVSPSPISRDIATTIMSQGLIMALSSPEQNREALPCCQEQGIHESANHSARNSRNRRRGTRRVGHARQPQS